MVLGMPVYHPTLPSHHAAAAGFALDGASIARLTVLRVPQVWIRYPGSTRWCGT